MKKKIFVAVFIFMLAAFMLSACGRNRNNENEENGNGVLAGSLQLTEGTHRLTVSVPLMQEPQFRRAGENLQAALANEGIHLDLQIDYFMDADWEEHFNTLLSQFAAGAGPDIVSGGFFPLPLYRLVENGFLADIYEIMDQSPVTSRADFFMNALEPLEIDGRLYTFPMQFGFEFVGINANAPAEFIERFAALEAATPTDLMRIYFDLTEAYPEWGEFAFVNGLWEHSMFLPEVARAIHFRDRIAQFSDPRTERLLEDMQRAFEGNYRFETEHVFPITEEFLATLASRYLFAAALPIGSGVFEAFLDFETPFFVHHTPVADNNGRLVTREFTGINVSISQTADPALAWAFVEQLISDTATDEFRHNPDIPIVRHYLQGSLESSFRDMFMFFEPRPFRGSQHDATANVIARFEKYSEMPMAPHVNFPVPLDALFEFFDGRTTARATLRMLETEITGWLNAERPPIGEYVPREAAQLYNPDLPTRVLTIHTPNNQTGVLRQAAAAMQADWMARGEPYNFRIEVDDFDWTDWAGGDARIARLQTELMAGQGPDIFALSTYHNLHAFAGSGFLADIYSLMDADPRTNRGDFFTQPLAAHEIAGGLYVFPTSFGFEYVAINAGLPQSVIDRFSALSSATLMQLFEIYLYLMENYGDEYGHLIFATSSTLGEAIQMVELTAAGFIDFNNRTASLTDPQFVAFLETLARVADGRQLVERWNVGGISETSWLRQQAKVSVFLMESGQATTFNAYFTPVNPIFAHYIPHVDEKGQLLLTDIRHRLLSYGAFCVTAAGDSALAWEFLQYVAPAFSQPVGSANICPVFGAESIWGDNFLASPIHRDMFEAHTRRTIDWVFRMSGIIESRYSLFNFTPQEFIGLDDPAERERQVQAVLSRMEERNDRPMRMMSPMLPRELIEDDFELFMLGVITPQDFAQRMQNSITLWLIE